jgi:hypothetical protein
MTLVLEDLSLEELGIDLSQPVASKVTPGPVIDAALERLNALIRTEGGID